MSPIHYIDRATRKIEKEKVSFESVLRFLYGNSFWSRLFGRIILHGIVKWPWCSAIVGFLQRRRCTKRHILPFIQAYNIDASEFEKKPDEFVSFDAFFSRRLKPGTRPIAQADCCIPADGKYQVFANVSKDNYFSIKGELLNLEAFLDNSAEAYDFYNGAHVVIGRLAPTDCHRFAFPVDCVSSMPKLLHGFLYSVHPIATSKRAWIYTKNKRVLTYVHSPLFGRVAMLEIGATSVGSIHELFLPDSEHKKGDEKGYFSFGGSAIILLFQKNKIAFDADLLEATQAGLEVRCLLGQSLGTKKA